MTESVNTAQHFKGKYSKSAKAVIHSDMAQVTSRCHHCRSSLVFRPIKELCKALCKNSNQKWTLVILKKTWGKCQQFLKC